MTELHVHLDGSMRPETIRELAFASGIDLPSDRFAVGEDCASLTEYLECFRAPLSVLQTKEALTRAVKELGEDLFADGVTRAEIRFAPFSSCAQGLLPGEAIEAAVAGAKEAMRVCKGLSLGLILCMMRGQEEAPFIGNVSADLTGERANFLLIDLAADGPGNVMKGVDLAGAEALYPTKRYGALFAYAKERGIPFTIHAGEADGARSVWDALSFGAKRIGHGVRAIEDPALVEHLVREQVTLECCVISNFHTKTFPTPEKHPIRRLFDAGVRVTINTDNRTISQTSIRREIETLQRLFHFTDEEIRKMEMYAQEALF